ncbi:MAG: PEP-CTERM sorting domain-containing protein [Phycisphaerae bacterium]|nr:PEP-CTERM sorting domain-containing protein [Phycisphaerae bacterium]
MRKSLVAILVVCFVVISPVGAVITDYNCADDGDGAIVMGPAALTYDGGLDEYTLAMDGVQNWFPAHVEGDFITDTELDPTVWIAETVDNQTNFAWTDYHIKIGMTKTFSISTSVIAPDYWTAVVTQPVAGQLPNGGGAGYVGVIDYFVDAGAPIGIGQSGDFGFKVSFVGTVAFCTEQIPTPEPATMALLSFGALILRRKK